VVGVVLSPIALRHTYCSCDKPVGYSHLSHCLLTGSGWPIDCHYSVVYSEVTSRMMAGAHKLNACPYMERKR